MDAPHRIEHSRSSLRAQHLVYVSYSRFITLYSHTNVSLHRTVSSPTTFVRFEVDGPRSPPSSLLAVSFVRKALSVRCVTSRVPLPLAHTLLLQFVRVDSAMCLPSRRTVHSSKTRLPLRAWRTQESIVLASRHDSVLIEGAGCE